MAGDGHAEAEPTPMDPVASAAPATPKSDWRSLRAAMFATCVFAVSQPLFDQLGTHPGFLLNHRLLGLRLWLFVLALTVALPAAAFLLTNSFGRWRPSAALTALRVALFVGLTLLALVVLRRTAPNLAAWFAFSAAGLVALAVTSLHQRSAWARDVGIILAWLAWVVPIVFLVRPEVRPLLHDAKFDGSVPTATATAVDPYPVVLVIWDELPQITLMNEDGKIDPNWFPAFARLAATSTWYRDTLSPGTMTSTAVPALLTGLEPTRFGDSTTARRRSVFELTRPSHALVAHSAAPAFLPPDAVLLGNPQGRAGWRVLVDDLMLLYQHLAMPASIRATLPPVSTALGNFRGGEHRDADLYNAMAALPSAKAAASKPLFVYLHGAMPHHPWLHLPSGTLYRSDRFDVARGLQGVAGEGRWVGHPWLTVQAYQRHVLQTMFTDQLLGRLIDALQASGLWDSALIIVTADHGASFEPNTPLRRPTPRNLSEVASVPLFVKRPGQTEAHVDDRRTSGLDIVPTIAASLGLEIPWPTDGRSLFGDDTQPDRSRRIHHPGESAMVVTEDLVPRLLTTARTRRALFAIRGDHGTERDPFRIGPYSTLVGRLLSELPVTTLAEPWFAERTSFIGPADRLEARVEFELDGLPEVSGAVAFAIAVDGRVEATSALFPGTGRTVSVMLPEEVAERLAGARVDLLRIDVGPGAPPSLRAIPTRAASYRLDPGGGTITSSDGGRWTVMHGTYHGELQELQLPGGAQRVLGWAVDAQERPPERLVVFVGSRSIASVRSGVPSGGFLDLLHFEMPEERIFFAAFPPTEGKARYFVLGADGRADELRVTEPSRE